MALIKRINGYNIHSKQVKREWNNKELKIDYKYFCVERNSDKIVFESKSLEEVINFSTSSNPFR